MPLKRSTAKQYCKCEDLQSLLHSKFSLGGGAVGRITFLCATCRLWLICMCVWVLLRYSIQSLDVEKFAEEFTNAEECMKCEV